MAFNVEAALIAWLPGKVGAPAYAQAPDPRPESFLTVERTGGTATIGIDYPTVAVRAWAGSAYGASDLALAATRCSSRRWRYRRFDTSTWGAARTARRIPRAGSRRTRPSSTWSPNPDPDITTK